MYLNDRFSRHNDRALSSLLEPVGKNEQKYGSAFTLSDVFLF